MDLSHKIKTALDETRMLILGAQILLGFQLRGAFADQFDQLPPYTQYVDAFGLVLMTLVIGVLIVPGPYHRLVENGADSGAFHALITAIANIALVPFALAIGLDVFLAAEGVSESAAIWAGVVAAFSALVLWCGAPAVRARFVGQRERAMARRRQDERQDPPLYEKIEQTLTEGRVILPGAQALFGFQLSIVLTQAFEQLPLSSRLVHAASLGLIAVSIMLLMAPAAYHRIVYAGEETQDVQRVAGWLITGATLPLAFGLTGDIYVVMTRIAGDIIGLTAAGGSLLALCSLWYGFPLIVRLRRDGMAGSAAKVQRQSG